jgi:hypothetical protein
MGKNSVTQIAFGRSVEEEYKDNLHNVSKVVVVSCYPIVPFLIIFFILIVS